VGSNPTPSALLQRLYSRRFDKLALVEARDGEKGVSGVLKVLGPRTRTLALLLLIVDSLFGVSIFSTGVVSNLSTGGFETAVICLVVVLLASVVAITIIELTVERNKGQMNLLRPSDRTPNSAVLNTLVNSTLEMICRTTSLPLAPDQARVRAFIFKREGKELLCKHYWAQNPTSEKVDITFFPLTEEAAEKVAVVRCALDRKITRTPIEPLPADLTDEGTTGVEPDLTFVLAAPILDRNKELWGTIDFDTSTEVGRERLSTPLADAAIFQLTQHLQVIFSLSAGDIPAPSANDAGETQPSLRLTSSLPNEA
jgi:hypothetical protein